MTNLKAPQTLIEKLSNLNRAISEAPGMALDETDQKAFNWPLFRLACYGSLRPGESNFHLVEMIEGEWIDGFLYGTITTEYGYLVYRWDEASEHKVPAKVLRSNELPKHWERLDDFEGDNYLRVLAPVHKHDGIIEVCYVYAKRPPK